MTDCGWVWEAGQEDCLVGADEVDKVEAQEGEKWADSGEIYSEDRQAVLTGGGVKRQGVRND